MYTVFRLVVWGKQCLYDSNQPNFSQCNYSINVTTETSAIPSREWHCEWEAKHSDYPNEKRRANTIIVKVHERNPEAIKVKRSWTSFAVMLTMYVQKQPALHQKGQSGQRVFIPASAVWWCFASNYIIKSP